MISRTYGRMVSRHEGAAAVELVQQYRTAKVEAMSLLSNRQKRSRGDELGEPACPVFDLAEGEYGPRRAKLPPAKRAKAGLTCRTYADVAQLVEHFTRNEGVRGSSPRVGFAF